VDSDEGGRRANVLAAGGTSWPQSRAAPVAANGVAKP